MPPFDLTGIRVGIRRPTLADCDEFTSLMTASRDFHHPWVSPPATRERFLQYIESRVADSDEGFLVCDSESGAILGVVNINCMVRRAFQSAYLGYYIGAPFAGQGYMTEGLSLATRFAFNELKLHRLEANIQPGNIASIKLAMKCGFRKEGFSPAYLNIDGQWRDHERWAVISKM